MALRFGTRVVDAELVAFDKDGTLIAFHALWHAWMDAFLQDIDMQIPLTEQVRQAFASILGWHPVSGEWDPLGPATLASTQEVALLASAVLYSSAGVDWPSAQAIVKTAYDQVYAHLAMDELITPTGDVTSLLLQLRESGIKTALVTADDRQPTMDTLARFGWTDLFDAILCGDDGFAQKPAPDLLLEACQRVGIAPGRTVMVGDTTADMTMARGAEVSLAVAVAGGSMPSELLAPYADVVLESIDDIVVSRGE